MLFTLIKLQVKKRIASLFNTKSKNSGLSAMGILVSFALIFGIVITGSYNLAELAYTNFHKADLDWFFFLFFSVPAVIAPFFFTVFTSYTNLFDSKDNDLLLSMPISHRLIILSRLISMWIIHILIIAIVMIPMEVKYCEKSGIDVLQILCFTALMFLLSLLSLTISILVGWIIGIATKNLRNKNMIITIMVLAFLVVYFFLVSSDKIKEIASSLITGAEGIAANIKGIYPLYAIGSSATKDMLSLITVLGIVVALFAIVFIAISKTFIGIATAKSSTKSIGYKQQNIKSRKVSTTLFKKEFSRFINTPAYILNSVTGLIVSIVVVIMTSFKVNDGTVNISVTVSSIIALILLCIFCSLDFVTAPSISLEAKTLWLLKSLPISPMDSIIAKLKLHIYICAPVTFITSIIAIVMYNASVGYAIFMLLLPLEYTFISAQIGMYEGIKHANFNWVTETQAVKAGIASLLSMLFSLLISLVTLAAAIVLPIILDFSFLISFSVLLVLLTVINVLLFKLIKTKGVKLYEKL